LKFVCCDVASRCVECAVASYISREEKSLVGQAKVDHQQIFVFFVFGHLITSCALFVRDWNGWDVVELNRIVTWLNYYYLFK
jgi:hypothetical protein